MSKIAAALAAVMLLSCATTAKKEGYTPKIVPACPKVKLPDGSYACKYTLEQVKQIYKAGAELDYRRKNDDIQAKDWTYYAVILVSAILSAYSAYKQ